MDEDLIIHFSYQAPVTVVRKKDPISHQSTAVMKKSPEAADVKSKADETLQFDDDNLKGEEKP